MAALTILGYSKARYYYTIYNDLDYTIVVEENAATEILDIKGNEVLGELRREILQLFNEHPDRYR
jgi:hypothetical protein